MTTLKETLRSDLTEAIRGRDEITVATLRMALAAITTEEVSGSAARGGSPARRACPGHASPKPGHGCFSPV